MTGIRQIEKRWGVEFWQLVRDFAEQGLPRSDVGKALGYSRDGFYTLLARNPGKDPFDSYDRAAAYVKETGESLGDALRRMARNRYNWEQAATEIGYANGWSLKRAAQLRGIKVDFGTRRGRPRTKPKTIPIGPDVSRGWPTWGKVKSICEARQ